MGDIINALNTPIQRVSTFLFLISNLKLPYELYQSKSRAMTIRQLCFRVSAQEVEHRVEESGRSLEKGSQRQEQ